MPHTTLPDVEVSILEIIKSLFRIKTGYMHVYVKIWKTFRILENNNLEKYVL